MNDVRGEVNVEQHKDLLSKLSIREIAAEESPPILPSQIQCFGCRVCGCEFADQRSLNMHVHLQHYHKQIRYNYVCAICKKQSATQIAMIKHLNDEHLIIKESQPIALKPCWDSYFGKYKRIARKSNCRRKQRMPQRVIHTKSPHIKSKFLIQLKIKWAKKLWIQLLSSKRLKCSLCHKSSGDLRVYNSKAALELHHMRKHAKKSLQCSYCREKFRFQYQLQLHKNVEHR